MTKKENSVYEQAFKSLVDKLNSTEKFILEQTPEVCQQLVTREMVELGGQALLALIALVVFGGLSAFSVYKGVNYVPNGHYEDTQFALFVCAGVLGILGLIAFGALYFSVVEFLKIKLAPKVFLISKIKNLIR